MPPVARRVADARRTTTNPPHQTPRLRSFAAGLPPPRRARPWPWQRPLPLVRARPTFLIIGAQKAGTSWLHRQLDAHPAVFVTRRKELQHFSNRANHARGLDTYLAHFAEAGVRHRARGESTPNYLWTDIGHETAYGGAHADDPAFRAGTPARIAAELGTDLRLVVLLRDPVDRAISAFYHHLRARGGGRIDPDAPFSENARRYGIVTMGMYAAHLTRWLEHFPSERFLVVIQEEMQRNPVEAIGAVQHHLGVRRRIPDGLERRIHTGEKFAGDDGWWYFDDQRRNAAITPDDTAWLDEVFAPDVARLEHLLGRQLILWPTVQRTRGLPAQG